MHVSPCGWFCFNEPKNWSAEDTRNSIAVYPASGRGAIVLSSARKEKIVADDEILQLQEEMIRKLGRVPRETSVTSLPRGTQCVQCVCRDHRGISVLVHVFWSRYCVQLNMESPLDESVSERANALEQILYSIEPLTTD